MSLHVVHPDSTVHEPIAVCGGPLGQRRCDTFQLTRGLGPLVSGNITGYSCTATRTKFHGCRAVKNEPGSPCQKCADQGECRSGGQRKALTLSSALSCVSPSRRQKHSQLQADKLHGAIIHAAARATLCCTNVAESA
jgi:hypothetical protein